MNDILLNIQCVSKEFEKQGCKHKALNGVSLQVAKGEILGITGISGSGKSTLLKMIAGLQLPTAGQIEFKGVDIFNAYKMKPIQVYSDLQMIFQNPKGSFHPKRTIRKSMVLHLKKLTSVPVSKKVCNDRIDELFRKVGLDSALADQYPKQLSGGQCQRAAIARALSSNPSVLLCDEITSALDTTVQARVIDLLKEINQEFDIAILFVTHDLSLAYNFCENLLVFHDGNCVEYGKTSDIIQNPQHEHTKELLSSICNPMTRFETV